MTYIACKCRPGADLDSVVRELRRRIPEDDVLTTQQFRELTFQNWERKTGVGPLMLFPSILAGLVGFLMVTLTFYISTIQKLPLYASLKAIGAATGELVVILIVQVASVFVLGLAVAAVGLWPVLVALRRTTIGVAITPQLVLAGCGALFFFSVVGAGLGVEGGDHRPGQGLPHVIRPPSQIADRAADSQPVQDQLIIAVVPVQVGLGPQRLAVEHFGVGRQTFQVTIADDPQVFVGLDGGLARDLQPLLRRSASSHFCRTSRATIDSASLRAPPGLRF